LALPLPASEAAAHGVVAAIEAQRNNQQIADLVSDVRHLQLDLEYHQQKLDQMLQEKQSNLTELKSAKGELMDAKKRIEEQDRLLKHRQVDLDHLQEELRTCSLLSGAPQAKELEGAATLDALRSEAAAKDSALVVSHYELHKEKLMRDRLEQKNIKLMERMQKLMMVVETMRRDTVSLEKSLSSKDKQCEERSAQLTQMTQRARQLHRQVKAGKAGSRDPKGQSGIILDFDGSSALDGLPGLRKQRSIDFVRGAAGGSRSGHSTPRTPRTPRGPPMTHHHTR
jgi:chromosome segregation ATPase